MKLKIQSHHRQNKMALKRKKNKREIEQKQLMTKFVKLFVCVCVLFFNVN